MLRKENYFIANYGDVLVATPHLFLAKDIME